MTEQTAFIRLRAETLAALRRHAIQGWDWDSKAALEGDGWYRVPLAPETLDRLRSVRLAGETDDDTVLRVSTLAGSRPN